MTCKLVSQSFYDFNFKTLMHALIRLVEALSLTRLGCYYHYGNQICTVLMSTTTRSINITVNNINSVKSNWNKDRRVRERASTNLSPKV